MSSHAASEPEGGKRVKAREKIEDSRVLPLRVERKGQVPRQVALSASQKRQGNGCCFGAYRGNIFLSMPWSWSM